MEKLEPYIKPYITKIDDAVGQLQRQISQAVQRAGGVVDDTFRLEPIAGETIETLGKDVIQESGEAAGRRILHEESETVETIQSSLDVKEEVQTVVADEVKIGGEGGSKTIDDVTGMDWYNYYRDTYGKENVCWESCNPSEVASAWQGSYPYTGVDAYTNITLHDGDIIYMGEPFPTGYSTTSEVAQTIGNDAQKVFGGLQVKPYYEKGMAYAEYRSKLTPYKVHGELNVADGVALNNPQFGQGGLAQRFDPNFDFNCANGVLEKLDNQTISLTNTKISLEEYFGMMNEIK